MNKERYYELANIHLDTLREYKRLLEHYIEIKEAVLSYSRDELTIEESMQSVIRTILKEGERK